ncbi:hypothetical protein NDU88_010562 [Pleurodeles waltl]|uniref:Uncharacterized protein n=1 Tax=Pleurodeles waltl TaxID=8319 RepID=A0AAV7S3N4_PLEWA|nr:hypothetical protein NDU88_010562 [Pleurodeles waltl]
MVLPWVVSVRLCRPGAKRHPCLVWPTAMAEKCPEPTAPKNRILYSSICRVPLFTVSQPDTPSSGGLGTSEASSQQLQCLQDQEAQNLGPEPCRGTITPPRATPVPCSSRPRLTLSSLLSHHHQLPPGPPATRPRAQQLSSSRADHKPSHSCPRVQARAASTPLAAPTSRVRLPRSTPPRKAHRHGPDFLYRFHTNRPVPLRYTRGAAPEQGGGTNHLRHPRIRKG